MYKVYILHSASLNKFYTGFTQDLDQRMVFHSAGMNSFSKKGIPWKVVISFEVPGKSEALSLEKQIKKNGAKRYMERNNIDYTL